MSFLREALKDNPVALHMMDDAPPFQDYSGYNRTSNQEGNGTLNAGISLVSDAAYSQIFTPTVGANFSKDVFSKGREDESFSLEVWLRIVTPGNAHQILSNFGQFDGIYLQGNRVSFSTNYVSGTQAIASFVLQEEQIVHVVGVHNQNKNSLYVNGVLVDEVGINRAPNDTYNNTNNNLYCGGGSSTNQTFMINGVGIYAKELTAERVLSHYRAGIDIVSSEEIATSFGATKAPLTLDNMPVFLKQKWSSENDWNDGHLENVSVSDSDLIPQFNGNVSVPGQWLTSFALSASEATSIYGVFPDWEGQGITVQTSLDGVTWTTATKGIGLTTVPAGTNPTNKELQVKVLFNGGVANDESYLSSLTLVGLNSGVSRQIDGRVTTMSNASPKKDYSSTLLKDGWGVEIAPGGSIFISPDSIESVPARTIEVWSKPKAENFSSNFGAGTFYVNGVAGSGFRVGEWNVTHYVANTDLQNNIIFSNAVIIGQVFIYPTALTAAQISEIYNKAIGDYKVVVNDQASISVTEISPAANPYGYDWTIQGAG